MQPPRFPNPGKKPRRPLLWAGLLGLIAAGGFALLPLNTQETRVLNPQSGSAEAAAREASGKTPAAQKNTLRTGAPAGQGTRAVAAPQAGGGEPDGKEYPAGRLADDLRFDRLYLEKSQRRLTAFSGGKAVRVYTVALGEQPVGAKRFQGDMKTPEGAYTINDKNPNSAYYKNVGISYPNKADREYAGKHGKPAGGDIKIHGLAPAFASIGKAHRETDWTYGCIAVTNSEMEEIYTRTPVGTPIEIVP